MSVDGKQINLGKLCWKLHDEFTHEEIQHVCAEFGFDMDNLKLSDSPASVLPYVYLINHIDRQNRIPDLLWLMETMQHPAEMVYLPSSDWTPRALPQNVIDKINGLLGIEGQEYYVLDDGEYHETGCVVWRFPPKEIDTDPESWLHHLLENSPSETGGVDPRLQSVREALVGLPVLAYRGGLSWGFADAFYDPDPIVVAPTSDPFDILRIERTVAINHDYTTAELIGMLQTLDNAFGVDITGASDGVIEFRITKNLKRLNLDELRQRLMDFEANTFTLNDLTETFLSGPIVLFWD